MLTPNQKHNSTLAIASVKIYLPKINRKASSDYTIPIYRNNLYIVPSPTPCTKKWEVKRGEYLRWLSTNQPALGKDLGIRPEPSCRNVPFPTQVQRCCWLKSLFVRIKRSLPLPGWAGVELLALCKVCTRHCEKFSHAIYLKI